MTGRPSPTQPYAISGPNAAAHPVRRPLWRAVRLTGVGPLALAGPVLAGTITIGSSIALAATSAWLIIRAFQAPPVLVLTTAVVGVRVFGISRGLFRYIERLASHRVALGGMTELRVRLYQRLADGNPAVVASLKRGDLLTRVGADVDDVGDLVVRGIIPGLVAVFVVIGTVATEAAFLPGAGLALLICLVSAGLAGPALTLRSAYLAEQRATAARADVAANVMTQLEHGAELAVCGAAARGRAELDRAERKLYEAKEAAAGPAALAAAVTDIATAAAVVAAFLLGLPALAAGNLAAVELGVIVLTPLAAFEAVIALPPAAAQVYRSRAAARRIVGLLDGAAVGQGDPVTSSPPAEQTQANAEPGGAATAASVGQGDPVAPTLPGGPNQVGVEPVEAEAGAYETRANQPDASAASPAALVAHQVVCAWPGGPTVLEGIDLTLAPGRAIGLVGPSGIGKTTLLETLAGLLRPRAGSVQIGGRDLADWPRAEAAQTVAFLAEDAHVFATSLLENLRVARGDVSPDEARAALEATGLGTWLASLDDGLDTVLGPDGISISGGERRRLLLARALVSPAQYLLLDEPGEHLDAVSGDQLTADLLGIANRTGRGVIVVTHRPAALGQADEVIRLAAGGIANRGRHVDLLATDPEYRRLANQPDQD